MQEYKKELFYNSYGKVIRYECISENEKTQLDIYIKENLGTVDKSEDFFILLKKALNANIKFDQLQTAEDIQFAINCLGLSQQKFAVVIWRYPTEMDTFELKYLIQYWEDIWYGDSDDAICLFFPEINRMILIAHYDLVYF